jgi:hypothetical protein
MSTYKIWGETLLRLANVVSFFESNVTEDLKSKIKTIRLENKAGRTVAIATNQKIGAVEYIGPTEAPDGVCYLNLSENLLNAAKKVAEQNQSLTITVIPEIAMATAQAGINGEFVADVCLWFDSSPLDKWRTWIVPPAQCSKGIMCWDLFHLELLMKASPTGHVVFPEFIDVSTPILLRDKFKDQEWLGIFIPSDKLTPDMERVIKERYLPTWLA